MRLNEIATAYYEFEGIIYTKPEESGVGKFVVANIDDLLLTQNRVHEELVARLINYLQTDKNPTLPAIPGMHVAPEEDFDDEMENAFWIFDGRHRIEALARIGRTQTIIWDDGSEGPKFSEGF